MVKKIIQLVVRVRFDWSQSSPPNSSDRMQFLRIAGDDVEKTHKKPKKRIEKVRKYLHFIFPFKCSFLISTGTTEVKYFNGQEFFVSDKITISHRAKLDQFQMNANDLLLE